MNRLIRSLKRGQSPAHRFARVLLRTLYRPQAPLLPKWLKPPLRAIYEFQYLLIGIGRLLITVLYRHPLFQARCASIGRNVSIDQLPFVSGHVEIHIGNNVWLGGNLSIFSGSLLERPQLIIKDGAEIGWNVGIAVSREVVIEENARVSYDCRISDSDGHPRQADLRAANQPVDPKDIRAIRICRNAWIGNGTHIMKGVTIGEGAVIGANSVVISDIPPFCLALGNPAQVYFRGYGKPSKKGAPNTSQPASSPATTASPN